MNRALLIGFLSLGLAACGDDGGSETGTDPSTTGTVDPTTEPTMTSSPMTTTETGTTTIEPGTTIGPDESSSGGSDTEAGSSSSGAADGSSSSGEPAEFAMTSPAFEQDGMFPLTMHCDGGNEHPQLDWVGAPAGTMSFGVLFRDLDFQQPAGTPFRHSAIWAIDATSTGLPADIEFDAAPASVPGAVQCRSWMGNYGYGGPGSLMNTYEFTLFALDSDDLSGEITSESPIAMVHATLEAHAIEAVTLSGQAVAPAGFNGCTPPG